jgi:hypothetical protein
MKKKNTICVGHHYKDQQKTRISKQNTTQRKVVERCVYRQDKSSNDPVRHGNAVNAVYGMTLFDV